MWVTINIDVWTKEMVIEYGWCEKSRLKIRVSYVYTGCSQRQTCYQKLRPTVPVPVPSMPLSEKKMTKQGQPSLSPYSNPNPEWTQSRPWRRGVSSEPEQIWAKRRIEWDQMPHQPETYEHGQLQIKLPIIAVRKLPGAMKLHFVIKTKTAMQVLISL